MSTPADQSTSEEIRILGKRVRLLQPLRGFRTSLDSVMLAAACRAEKGQSLLDLGCGVGGAGLCVLTRIPDTKLTGIDIQSDHIALASQNAALNGMDNRASFIAARVPDYKAQSLFDHVICNPPYLEAGAHAPSPHAAKATAHGHSDDTELKDWIDCAFYNLKSKGSLTMIHRADHTDTIIRAMGKRFGATEIIPLWPKSGIPAKRVIIRTLKDRRSPVTLHPGITLHRDNGAYTAEAEEILSKAKAII
ncbi:MAG: methyltransferase [Alphaproteobacteria bacterium]|nr:methyltransferase [Alphaproteobacteria bacterium]